MNENHNTMYQPPGGDSATGFDPNTEFEQVMEQRIHNNFASPIEGAEGVTDERLQDLNKKLPAWSLEPPFGYLK